MSAAEELDKLKKMRDDGTITEEQYERAAADLRAERRAGRARRQDDDDEGGREERRAVRARRRDDEGDDREERRPRRRDYDDDDEPEELSPREREKKAREWAMFLHLSLFAGHLVPFGGIIVPIVMWQSKKDELPKIDRHGKNAVNWVLSSVLYAIVCVALCFVFVGFVLLPVLLVLNVVFPIIAAVKANEGRVWRYPLAIPFIP